MELSSTQLANSPFIHPFPHLRRIFAEQPCDGLEVEWSARILASVEGVEGIDPACLAENSLYHEFILI